MFIAFIAGSNDMNHLKIYTTRFAFNFGVAKTKTKHITLTTVMARSFVCEMRFV